MSKPLWYPETPGGSGMWHKRHPLGCMALCRPVVPLDRTHCGCATPAKARACIECKVLKEDTDD